VRSCTACGSELAPIDAYCTRCGSSQPPPEGSHSPASTEEVAVMEDFLGRSGVQRSQIASGLWAACAVAWIAYSPAPLTWTLLLAPSILACMWPVVRHAGLTAWSERREGQLRAASARAAAKGGKFSRFFSSPLYGGCLWIWRKTQPVNDRHLRAGLRVAAILYLACVMISVAAFVGYVVIGVLIAIAVLFFIIWLAGRILGGEQPSGRPRDDEETGSTWSPSLARRATLSRPGTDLFGNRRTDVLDNSGKKVAEVRPTTDLFGNPKEEIYDASGKKIGERRPSSDFLGNPKTEEFNSSDQKVGESHPNRDFLGDPVEEHFDNSGKKIGESRPDTDLLGDPVVRHKWKKED
jgi:hypothetical protein